MASSDPPLVKQVDITFEELTAFAMAMVKVRDGSVADARIELNRDDCRALLWGIGVLKDGGRAL